MKAILGMILAMGLLLSPAVQADTIYSWTDDQGVQRFSNEPPTEGVEYKTFQSQSTQAQTQPSENQRRPSYDEMVQKASEQSRQLEQQRKAEAAERAREAKRQAEAQRKEKIRARRRQLEDRIKSIKNRALGPHFTQGMKEAQIEEIKKQIEALENDSAPAKP